MNLFDRVVYLYLADGRLFVRRDGGEIHEADPSERGRAVFMLGVDEGAALDPARGLEVVPPAES